MTCPVCGGKTKVVDSRVEVDNVLRRRNCIECGYRIYTEEIETANAREEINRIHRNRMARKKGVNA